VKLAMHRDGNIRGLINKVEDGALWMEWMDGWMDG